MILDAARTSLRIVTIVGARPQFIKAAPMSRALAAAGHAEYLVHTGQHYDADMSARFFDELSMTEPAANLHAGSGSHAEQTSKMLVGIEQVLVQQRPDAIVLYGDTNSTVAGSLAAAKLGVPIAHVEAGLRSFDRSMPEEINRVVTDHLAALLWAPSQVAADNLRNEGIVAAVEIVGDIMLDALNDAAARVADDGGPQRFGVEPGEYLVATIHRADNTEPARLAEIVGALNTVAEPIVWPVHPRTRARLDALAVKPGAHVRLTAPLGHRDLISLVRQARMVLTDSGGLQKETYWLKVPCVTLRDSTEWAETVDAGWNVLTGASADRIVEAVRSFTPRQEHPMLYGDGRTAARCVSSLERACAVWSGTGAR